MDGDRALEWHPATVSLRGEKYYVVMTVPLEARAAMNGTPQVRRSARTTDRKIAEQRRFELEGVLREQVIQAVRKAGLHLNESKYQRAVRELRLMNHVYGHGYDVEFKEPILLTLAEPPKNQRQAEDAIQQLQQFALSLRQAELTPEDAEGFLRLYEHFQGQPPSAGLAQEWVDAAVSELGACFTTDDASPTLSSYLDSYERKLELRIGQNDLKPKTAKARVKNIRQFIDVAGDLPLHSLQATNAYAFAQHLAGEGHANSTIKTRISDVSTMLEAAVQEGELAQNPFLNLRLSRIGTRGQHYAPLTDELLGRLFYIPKLPQAVREIWAVLICTGMRLDEAALCKLHQVKEQDGIMYFDLQNAEVKNRQSQRRVPICGTLEPLIRQMLFDRAGCDRLFDFPIKADGKSRASEKCGYWMKKVDLNKLSGDTSARYTNHSLRGSFKDKMRDAEVGLEVHNAILGHDQHTVSASYGRGPSLAAMKAAVDKARHPYLAWIAQASTAQEG